jgi:hypothetical protein
MAQMKLIAFQVHRSWLVPAVLVLLVTVVVDGVVVCCAQRPPLWAALIPGTLPLSMWFFVALPLLREEKRKSRTDVLGRK